MFWGWGRGVAAQRDVVEDWLEEVIDFILCRQLDPSLKGDPGPLQSVRNEKVYCALIFAVSALYFFM